MKLACLFSGGKDSVFAAFCCLSQGHEVELVSVRAAEDSMMFHHPNARWRKMQAECMGLKLREIETGDDELSELEAFLKKMKLDGVVSGALASEYQKEKIDAICERLGLRSFAPLWHTGENALNEMIANFEIYVVAVAAEGLGKEWLGRKFDARAVEELGKLKTPVHVMFEGGEGETFVADAPFFSKRIEILEWEKKWDGTRGVAEIKRARVVEKAR